MASLLTSEMHSIDGVVKYIAECRSHDIPVLPPDIHESDIGFSVTGENIRFGLVAVKNVGEGAIESIIETRSNRRFSSLFDFCESVDLKRVNKRVIESLIKCGAFDFTGAKRSQMTACLEEALEYGQRVQKEKNDPQMGLFDVGEKRAVINAPEVPNIQEWDEKQRLTYEKEALGFYISGHPLGHYETVLDKFTNANAVTVRELSDGETVRIGGILSQIKTINTKKGDLMAFVTLEDMHGSVEAVVFSSIYYKSSDLLFEDSPVLIRGRVQKDDQAVKIIADSVIPMDKAEESWTASIHFHLDVTRTDRQTLVSLQETLQRHPGACRAYLHLRTPQGTETIIAVSEQTTLQAGSRLIRDVNGLLGYPAVKTVCSTATSADNQATNGNKRYYRNGRQ